MTSVADPVEPVSTAATAAPVTADPPGAPGIGVRPVAAASPVEALARLAVHRGLRGVRGGQLTVGDAAGTAEYGTPGADHLRATVAIHDPATYPALLRGSRGLAESYADGRWDCDDLVALTRIAARSMRRVDPLRERTAAVVEPLRRAAAALRTNTRSRSRSNVERHYDLGNELFAQVLDDTMGYSCAFWPGPAVAAAEASRANLDRVVALLDLRPGDHLLEMGSGWGGLAVHAASGTGCRVSTVTLSTEQRAYIERVAAEAGVGDRVEVLVTDYRDVRGRWDRVVSLEMIEAVGADHLGDFLGQCGRLVRSDGLVVLQAITTGDRLHRIDRHRLTFLNELIFPGGSVPSLEAILAAAARRTDLRAVAVYDITPHYPPTLRTWRARLLANWERIRALPGFDERFRRLWTLYFSWCEAGFLERRVQDRQIILAGPDWRDENRLTGTPGVA